MRQTLGFSVFGGFIGLVAAAAADAVGVRRGFTDYVVSSMSSTASPFADHPMLSATVVGAVLGAIVGLGLRLCGLRMSGHPGDRLFRVVAGGVGTAGIVVGAVLAVLFTDAVGYPGTAWLLTIYAVTGLAAYGLSLGCVRVVLAVSDDPHAAATVRALAWTVPVGAAAAVAVGVGTAALLDFSTDDSTWIATCAAVLIVTSAAFAAGRLVAVRRRPVSAVSPDRGSARSDSA